jgi:hypothetical protein
MRQSLGCRVQLLSVVADALDEIARLLASDAVLGGEVVHLVALSTSDFAPVLSDTALGSWVLHLVTDTSSAPARQNAMMSAAFPRTSFVTGRLAMPAERESYLTTPCRWSCLARRPPARRLHLESTLYGPAAGTACRSLVTTISAVDPGWGAQQGLRLVRGRGHLLDEDDRNRVPEAIREHLERAGPAIGGHSRARRRDAGGRAWRRFKPTVPVTIETADVTVLPGGRLSPGHRRDLAAALCLFSAWAPSMHGSGGRSWLQLLLRAHRFARCAEY